MSEHLHREYQIDEAKIQQVVEDLTELFNSPKVKFSVKVNWDSGKDEDTVAIQSSDSEVTYVVPPAFLRISEEKLRETLVDNFLGELEKRGVVEESLVERMRQYFFQKRVERWVNRVPMPEPMRGKLQSLIRSRL